ncbi:hypothetical protein V1283_003345 [Bradyrhizobium sp. AZCC 2262]|uniref:hypothetical protein n=1 Tax=Bradyrhizobium sp. AZCC 2262 TaxID=3117022 RepID=UPI002FF171B5
MSKWQDLRQRGGCAPVGCGLPAGFFRVRYFSGKQMRLADYVDEQRYHAGKMRFHNEHLHGAGILCGLKVSLLDPCGLVIRVGKGAAIDACGREIVVGFDQCVDVEAWFKAQHFKYKDSDENPCKPDKDRRVRVCVVMRYAECAGQPEPAPASKCGGGSAHDDCGCGGETACDPCNHQVEFGRISEEFEMRMMFHAEAEAASVDDLFPAKDMIDAAVSEASGGVGLLKAIAKPIRQGCAAPDPNWLLLACFDLVLDDHDDHKIVKIDEIDYDCASQVLLSTEVIQYLLATLFAEIDPAVGGPEVLDISFRKLNGNRYQFVLTLSAPVEQGSLDKDDSFAIRRLTGNGWDEPANNAVDAFYREHAGGEYLVDGPAIYVVIDNAGGFLANGGRYQLYVPDKGQPVVDSKLRQLRPRHLAWRFGLSTNAQSGDLEMQPL